MKTGFIGAGKVGFTLGRYFKEHQTDVTGFYSRNHGSAVEAAEFTGTVCYDSMADLVRDSDVIFITVPDDAVASVWEQLKENGIYNRIICHCCGVLSSEVFSDMDSYNCYGYSVHPLFAVNSKKESYQELSGALFTIEGEESHRDIPAGIIRRCGNRVVFLKAEQKTQYHCAAVIASNLINGLMETAAEVLCGCGFTRDEAFAALVPLAVNNMSHLKTGSIEEALTGPVERGDTDTVKRHIDCLSGDVRDIYTLLSGKVLQVAERKNPEYDYKKLEEILHG